MPQGCISVRLRFRECRMKIVDRIVTQKLTLTLAVLTIAVGCQRQGGSEAAIRRAIETHLSSQSSLAMNLMTIEIEDIQVEGDLAQAEVVFRTITDPLAHMGYHYDLVSQQGEWRVESGRPSSTDSPHPSAGDGGQSGEEIPGLPEDHPPIPPPQ